MTNRSGSGFLDDFVSAIESNDLNLIESLLSHGKVDASAAGNNSSPVLVHAARSGRVQIVELLLHAGARIDDVDDNGQSACHVAAMVRHIGVMRCLLAHRPNLSLKTKNGSTALEIAMQIIPHRSDGDVEDITLLLIRAGASLDEVNCAILCQFAASSTTAIQILMDHNVIVGHLRDEHGRNPLHLATLNCVDSAVLRKLVDCGIDLEARVYDAKRLTCSGIAIARGNANALEQFLLLGANVDDADDSDRSTLLHKSVAWKSLRCTTLLLAAGADVSARGRFGRTACQMMPYVHTMLAAGIDLDAADDKGDVARDWLNDCAATIDAERVEAARREIAQLRLDFVRHRALEVCIGLQPLRLDALQLCVILQHACGPLARVIAFHQWWSIATTVKHFQQ
jgi:ankyrin repeat protein